MRTYKSPTRLFAFGLLGLLLILASVDVMFAHWVSTEPENTDGVLTTRGQAQQRGDIIWGAVMLGTGTLLFGGALVELVRRQPQCVIDADGIVVPMGEHGDDVTVSWSNISGVRGDLVQDGFDGSMRESLIIDVLDPSDLPNEPQGAQWNGNELQIDAQNWTRGVGEFAIAAQGALGHFRRVDEIKQMGAPSLTWRTSVAAGGDLIEQTAAGGDIDTEDELPVESGSIAPLEDANPSTAPEEPEVEPESAASDGDLNGTDGEDRTDPEGTNS